jgi:hypothetical protein
MIVRILLRTVRSLLRSSIKLQLLFKSLPLSPQRYEAQEHDEQNRPDLFRTRRVPVHRSNMNDELLRTKLDSLYCIVQIDHGAHHILGTIR